MSKAFAPEVEITVARTLSQSFRRSLCYHIYLYCGLFSKNKKQIKKKHFSEILLILGNLLI